MGSAEFRLRLLLLRLNSDLRIPALVERWRTVAADFEGLAGTPDMGRAEVDTAHGQLRALLDHVELTRAYRSKPSACNSGSGASREMPGFDQDTISGPEYTNADDCRS